MFFFYIQLKNLIQDLPSIRAKLDKQVVDLQLTVQKETDISHDRQVSYLRNQSFGSHIIKKMETIFHK